jgi:hypothetical protein
MFFTASAKDHSPEMPSLSELDASIDKQPVQITSLRSATDDKLLFALVLDVSTSQAPRAGPIKEAAMQLFQALAASGNQGYLVVFDVGVMKSKRPLQFSEVQGALDRIKFGGGTALFDAIGQTCTTILSRAGNPDFPRRAIVLISDGDDNQSRMTPKEAIEAAEKEGVAIFSLATSSAQGPGERFLGDATRNTGGQESTAKNIEDGVKPLLSAINGQLAIDLASPVPPDQKLHSFVISTSNKNVQLSAPAKILIQ